MTAGLLTGLGRGLQQAGETYGKFKMYDIEQQRKDDLLERKWGHEDDVREDEQLAELNRAKVNAKSKVDKAVIEAEIKRFKYKNEIIGVDDNNQPITRQQLMKGYDGPVHAMSKKDSGSTSGTDINRVLKAGKEAFGDKFSLDGWNPGGKPSEGKIKTFNRILEANNMPPVSVQTDVGKDEGLFWFDKEKWKFVPNKPEAQIPQGGIEGGLLTSKPAIPQQGAGQQKKLTPEMALEYLRKFKGDRAAAEKAAKEEGFTW